MRKFHFTGIIRKKLYILSFLHVAIIILSDVVALQEIHIENTLAIECSSVKTIGSTSLKQNLEINAVLILTQTNHFIYPSLHKR